MPTRNFRRLEADLRQYVVEAARRRTPLEEMLKGVEEILRPYFDARRLDQLPAVRRIIESAREQYDWIGSRQIDTEDRRIVERIIRQSGSAVAAMGGKVNRRVLDDIQRGLRRGSSVREIENAVARHVRRFRAAAETIAVTAVAGFDQANTFRVARLAGVERFKYDGPPGERVFCREQMALAAAGRTYTREEIRSLDNGQRLPVEIFIGGWRCRHQWIAVVG